MILVQVQVYFDVVDGELANKKNRAKYLKAKLAHRSEVAWQTDKKGQAVRFSGSLTTRLLRGVLKVGIPSSGGGRACAPLD